MKRPDLGAWWRVLKPVRWSLLACLVSLLLSVLSMGLLGAGLYLLVSPVTSLFFPGMDDWHGDWVWPAVIGVGMAWSPAFLLAAWVNCKLRARAGFPRWALPVVYAGVLWLWALALWLLVLSGAPR